MLICAAYIHRVFLVQTAILDLNLVENPGLAALKKLLRAMATLQAVHVWAGYYTMT